MNLTLNDPIVKQFDYFFDDIFGPQSFIHRPNAPSDIIEKDNVYILSVELPGVSRDDIHVEFENKSLRVKAKKKKTHEDDNANKISGYRDYTEIDKMWAVSDSIDVKKISSEYKDGVLTIKLPKKSEAKARKISVG